MLVYFGCRGGSTRWGGLHPFARPVAPGASLDTRLHTAFAEYFVGPSRREGRGYFTFVDGFEGAAAVNATDVVGTRAVVDVTFDNRGHTTSAQVAHLWNALARLAFQFPSITEMEPRLDGSCEAFGAAVEAGRCLVLLRGGRTVPGP